MKLKLVQVPIWFVMKFARLLGFLIGTVSALLIGLWRYAKLPVSFFGIGAFIGASAGIAIGGEAHNAMIAFAVFGGLVGIVSMVFWKRAKMIRTRNGL